MTQQEFKAHVEDISKNNTCHRPDISAHGPCDKCPFTKYCLCRLNTYFNPHRRKKRKIKYGSE